MKVNEFTKARLYFANCRMDIFIKISDFLLYLNLNFSIFNVHSDTAVRCGRSANARDGALAVYTQRYAFNAVRAIRQNIPIQIRTL